jgi:hypothetical protein
MDFTLGDVQNSKCFLYVLVYRLLVILTDTDGEKNNIVQALRHEIKKG